MIASPMTLVLSPFLLAAFVLGGVSKRRPRKSVVPSPPGEIVMLAVSEVFRDPRIEREARALAAAGFQIKILYPEYWSTALRPVALDWGPGISFVALPEYFGAYVYGFPYLLGFNLLRRAMRERPFAFHAHDLRTSIVALAAARMTNAHCVCDFHEWYSENVTWSEREGRYAPHPRHIRWIFALGERVVLRRASAVVTVCESIADALRAQSGGRRDVTVVRNVPDLGSRNATSSTAPLRSQLSLKANTFVVLYQGGTGPIRLLEPVIEAVRLVPGVVLVIRGPGIEHSAAAYRTLAQSLGIEDRVFCLEPVPSAEVVDAARDADVGLYTVENLCKNFYYALPNKLFEYLAAGLPVLTANYPEAARIVERYRVGLTFDPYSPPSIAAAINTLARNPALKASMKANARTALEDMGADTEWDRLVSLYDDLRANSASPEASATERGDWPVLDELRAGRAPRRVPSRARH
jgi:glycosyltransferase involved in cell wall biosynthesis